MVSLQFLHWIAHGRPNGMRARAVRRWRGAPSEVTAPVTPPPTRSDWVQVALVSEVGEGRLFEGMADGVAVILTCIEGDFFAYGATCPHAGGPLGEGEIQGTTLSCPYHGWAFDLGSGACETHPSAHLERRRVRVRGEALEIERVRPDLANSAAIR